MTDAAGSPSTARPEMTLDEAEDWWIFWETLGSRSRPDDMEEREAVRVLHAEYDRLRALAGEAEPDGAGPEEVWIPPSTDCMDHAHEPCPHCGSRIHHMRTDRCGTCGRRPVPAGGSAPAAEGRAEVLSLLLRGMARRVGEFRETAAVLDDPDAMDGLRQGQAGDAGAGVDLRALLGAGGSAPHQGATTAHAALRRVVDVLDFADGGCELPVTAEIDTDVVRAALVDHDGTTTELRAAVRALLGAGETTEETHG